MARPGRDPDPRSIHRNPLAEWTEVDEIPYDFEAAGRSLPDTRPWHPDVVEWFEVAAALPHATLWRDGDWRAVYDLAIIKQQFYQGAAPAALIGEMRQRENHLGLTEEARYKNRIRYVPVGEAPVTVPASEAETPAPVPDNVTPIGSARDRLKRGA